jgi:hypothetical protein
MEIRADWAPGDELREGRRAISERTGHADGQWVEVLDRGQNARPRYVVTSSGFSMAGGTESFIAAMEFASRIGRLLNCGSSLRRS